MFGWQRATAGSRTLVAIAIAGALLVAGIAVALHGANNRSRDELKTGMSERADVAAALIESTFSLTAQSQGQQDRLAFANRRVSDAQVRALANQVPGQTKVVADGRGRVIAAWPPQAARKGTSIVGRGEHVRRALAGQAWTATVATRGAASVEVALALSTPYGRRISVTTYPAPLIQAFLGSYLQRIRGDASTESYLVDTKNNVIGTGNAGAVERAAIPSGHTGEYTRDGVERFFASARVAGTDWRVVLSRSKASLYAPISGATTWLPWLLVVAFSGMLALVVVLVRRLLRNSNALAAANEELARRNMEVVEADRLKSEFLATMSHELRTPLNGIIGFSELMHDGRVGAVSDQHREYLGDILTSSRHLRRLIDDVLDLSKIEAGKLEITPEPTQVDRLVSEVCQALRSLATRRGIELSHDVDPELGTIDVDPGKLKQILFNYLSNALKFTQEGGNVSVTVRAEGDDRFRIVVEDDGPGIAPEAIPHLWSAFRQLDGGATRRYGGTGLGLALTKRLVEAQGGEVGVTSTPGVRTAFSAVLPRHISGGIASMPILASA